MRRPVATAAPGTAADAGYSTVLVLALAAILLSLSGVLVTLATIAVTRHRAESLADVAALTAAQHAQQGPLVACAAAKALVGLQGGHLQSCRLIGFDAVVVVGVRPGGRAGSLGFVRGTARAGRR